MYPLAVPTIVPITGTTEFDPDKVGFVVPPGPTNPFVFDTSIAGNSNLGHDMGWEHSRIPSDTHS